jgi:hypothetical protein
MLGQVVSGVAIAVVPGKIPGGVAVTFTIVVVALAVVGFLQWLILRTCTFGLRWWGWVFASVVGQLAGTSVVSVAVVGSLRTGALGGVGAHLGGYVLQLATKVTSGALLGAVEGFAHWVVLRRHFRAAGWWILAMICAEALAAAAALIIGTGAALDRLVALIITRLTSGFLVGAITGAVLVWLVRERPRMLSDGG